MSSWLTRKTNKPLLDVTDAHNIALEQGGDIARVGAITKLRDWLMGSTGGTYERHVQIPALLAGSAATQPTPVGIETVGGLSFPSNANKSTYCQFEILEDWDGTDIKLEIDWFPDGAMNGTHAVKWDLEYRSIYETEPINQGTIKTLTVTDSTARSQYQTIHTPFTLPVVDANQPLTLEDHLYFKITRDVSVANDYPGAVIVSAFEFIYNSTGFPRG